MHSDDLGLGVKSHSNSAMAGSCRNMPKYSLPLLACEVKYGLDLQSLLTTEFFPTQNLHAVERRNQGWRVRCYPETRIMETIVKVPKFMLSVSNLVENLRQ